MTSHIKVTVILKELTDQFFEGFGDSIVGFNTLDEHAKFEKCRVMHGEGRVTMKIGSGQFRDAVDLNHMRKIPHSLTYKLEPRRGYRLATFNFSSL